MSNEDRKVAEVNYTKLCSSAGGYQSFVVSCALALAETKFLVHYMHDLISLVSHHQSCIRDESLRKNDGDGYGNARKNRLNVQKTTALHALHFDAFLCHSRPDNDVK